MTCFNLPILLVLTLTASVASSSFASTIDPPLSQPLDTLGAGNRIVMQKPFFIAANCEDCNAIGTPTANGGCTFHAPLVLNYDTQLPIGDTLIVKSARHFGNEYGAGTYISFESGAYLKCSSGMTINDLAESLRNQGQATLVILPPTVVNY